MKKMFSTLFLFCIMAALTIPACALEYSISAPAGPDYGKPTSFEPVVTVDSGARKNEDVSKNAALIPPGFGTPSADTLHTGEYLTPNLAPGGMPVTAAINGTGSAVVTPGSAAAAPSAGSASSAGSGSGSSASDPRWDYTRVTDDLYYNAGHLGTLKINAIDLNVKIYQGTDSATLRKGVGHFEDTSIWNGNVALAAHNRGANSYFGKIHTLEYGDRITLTTKLGTRTYRVTSVAKVSETDRSSLASTVDNCLTLYTCVRDQSDLRWCVRAVQV